MFLTPSSNLSYPVSELRPRTLFHIFPGLVFVVQGDSCTTNIRACL